MDRRIPVVTAALFVVLATATHVSRADDATPHAGAPPVCKPHADPKPAQDAAEEALEAARGITADSLASEQTVGGLDTVSAMLRQMAAIVECDKTAITHWPTVQECMAMPIRSSKDDPFGVDVSARTVCLNKVHAGAMVDALASKARDEADRVEPLIAAEVACRASAKCMADRAIQVAEANLKEIVNGLCQDIAVKRDAYATIARENSNPAGVRDLVALHEAGKDIQDMNAEIARLKGLYAAQIAQPGMRTKRPFTVAICKAQ
jgi:hypothetical protein